MASVINREAWLEERRHGIGGSDAPVIMGVSPWKTILDLWLEKTGEYTLALEEDKERIYWGRVLEDIVAQEFVKRTGIRVRRCNRTLTHPKYKWMIGNVDRLLVGEKAGLEIKTTNTYAAGDWDNKIPDYYYPQVQHYIEVRQADFWWVAVLIGGQEFRTYKVLRDDTYIKELVEAEAEFWRLVEKKTPPPIDGSEAASEYLKRTYPRAEAGKIIELPFEAYELVLAYERLSEEEKNVQKAKEEAANKLKAMLGDAEIGIIHDKKVIWKNISSKRLDTKAIQKEFPEVYEKCLVESVNRRFQIR